MRLLVSDNYNLRIHTVCQLPEGKSYLGDLHNYLENKIRCDNFLSCIALQTHLRSNEFLEMLGELIQVQQKL